MRVFRSRIYALSAGAAAILLAACGGAQSPIAAPGAVPQSRALVQRKEVFEYTGGEQSFTVPSAVTRVRIDSKGASGGGKCGSCDAGNGGLVRATIPVTPGEMLYIFVGGAGGQPTGGFNGGGNGGKGRFEGGYGGGGASDIRESGDALNNRVIIAAGGGGSGDPGISGYGGGGDGGGRVGENGLGHYVSDGDGGGGGDQRRGGSGGEHGQWRYCGGESRSGSSGKLGVGGNGGNGACDDASGGGGGGAGYYGGGGGGGGNDRRTHGEFGGGGGGGSSFIERGASGRTDRTGAGSYIRDSNNGNGKVTISWQGS